MGDHQLPHQLPAQLPLGGLLTPHDLNESAFGFSIGADGLDDAAFKVSIAAKTKTPRKRRLGIPNNRNPLGDMVIWSLLPAEI